MHLYYSLKDRQIKEEFTMLTARGKLLCELTVADLRYNENTDNTVSFADPFTDGLKNNPYCTLNNLISDHSNNFYTPERILIILQSNYKGVLNKDKIVGMIEKIPAGDYAICYDPTQKDFVYFLKQTIGVCHPIPLSSIWAQTRKLDSLKWVSQQTMGKLEELIFKLDRLDVTADETFAPAEQAATSAAAVAAPSPSPRRASSALWSPKPSAAKSNSAHSAAEDKLEPKKNVTFRQT
jgi:hypothetical protein